MAKGKNTAEILDGDDELYGEELSNNKYQERTLILKAAPPSRRAQLIAHGAIEIRCAHCGQIRPLAKAEESEEGWICHYCVTVTKQRSKNRGKK